MKDNKNSFIISGILGVALIVLYILHFTSNSSSNSNNSRSITSVMNDSSITLPVAYVNVDSLLLNYNYAKDLNESFMRTQENSRATLSQKEAHLNKEAQEFERKRQNNAFLTQDRAKQEYERIMRLQQEYQQVAERLTQELALEQQKMNIALNDTVKANLLEFNKDKKFEIIFSNTSADNILYAADKYNVTNEFVEFLNKKYGPATTAASAATQTKKTEPAKKK